MSQSHESILAEEKAKKETKIKESQFRILSEAWKVAQKRWEEEGGELEVTIWDMNEVFKNNRDLIEEVSQETIRSCIEQGKQWLLKQKNPQGLWGWWAGFDPQELRADHNLSKIWTTAIVLRALIRNGYPIDSPEVVQGIPWLLNNMTPSGGWSRLPQNYGRNYPDLCLIPNAYETSCALLTLLEVLKSREMITSPGVLEVVELIDNSQSINGVVDLIERSQRDSGDWPSELTEKGRANNTSDVGATAVILGALKRTKTGAPEQIRRGIEWLKKAQNANGGWGFTPNSHSVTTKTGDVLRALIEAGVDPKEKCIKQGAIWLHRNQGPGGVNGSSWGWGRTASDGIMSTMNVENTGFAIVALMRAGFSQRIPSIQAGLRWITTSMSAEAWQEDTPRVIMSLHECLYKTQNIL